MHFCDTTILFHWIPLKFTFVTVNNLIYQYFCMFIFMTHFILYIYYLFYIVRHSNWLLNIIYTERVKTAIKERTMKSIKTSSFSTQISFGKIIPKLYAWQRTIAVPQQVDIAIYISDIISSNRVSIVRQ